MAEAKEKLAQETKERVRDYTEIAKELTGLVREGYLMGFQLSLSLWEGNLKIINGQIDQWLNLQQNYANAAKELYEKLPAPWNGNSKGINGHVDRFVAFHKDQVDLARSVSDRVMKETLNLTQKNVEKAFSLFDGYLGMFKF